MWFYTSFIKFTLRGTRFVRLEEKMAEEDGRGMQRRLEREPTITRMASG